MQNNCTVCYLQNRKSKVPKLQFNVLYAEHTQNPSHFKDNTLIITGYVNR